MTPRTLITAGMTSIYLRTPTAAFHRKKKKKKAPQSCCTSLGRQLKNYESRPSVTYVNSRQLIQQFEVTGSKNKWMS